jgi:hypothetical protein
MAIVKCPKCSHEVQPSVAECPQCGLIFKRYQEGVLKAQKHKEEKEKRARTEQLKKLIPCNACRTTISKRARSCPKCGEPQIVEEETQADSQKADVTGFIDFRFTNLITPELVKLTYAVVFIVAILGCLGGIVSSFTLNTFGGRIGSIFASIVGSLFLILIARITCESALILFKIEDNTRS